MEKGNSEPKISIIIPYYNTETSLFKKCIKSVIDQTFTDFEAIIIDDGSKEEYQEIARHISEMDARIKYVYKENGGVSSARNKGIQLSRGEYLTFLDSDDEIVSYFLEESYKIIQETKVDFLIGGIVFVEKGCVPIRIKEPEVVFLDDQGIHNFKKHIVDEWLYFDSEGHISRGPIARLVKRSLALECPFREDISIGEDIVWNLKITGNIKKMAYVKQIWYIYNINPLSATHRYSPSIIEDQIKQLKAIGQYLDFKNDDEYVAYHNHIFECLRGIYECLLCKQEWDADKKEKQEVISKLYNDIPWKYLTHKRYWACAAKKNRLKIFLYKRKLLFLFWMLKDKVKK